MTIWCDNTGENLSLQQECLSFGLGIQFEFTSPHTPQLNGRVDCKFATITSGVRASLNVAQLPTWLRYMLWAESTSHETDLQNILLRQNQE